MAADEDVQELMAGCENLRCTMLGLGFLRMFTISRRPIFWTVLRIPPSGIKTMMEPIPFGNCRGWRVLYPGHDRVIGRILVQVLLGTLRPADQMRIAVRDPKSRTFVQARQAVRAKQQSRGFHSFNPSIYSKARARARSKLEIPVLHHPLS